MRRARDPRRDPPQFVYALVAESSSTLGISPNPLQCALPPPAADDGPSWHLALVVGPFWAGADAFLRLWRRDSRKVDCRLAYGCLLAQLHRDRGLRVWAANPTHVQNLAVPYARTQRKRLLEACLQLNRTRLVCR